jgi:hypothetical protein
MVTTTSPSRAASRIACGRSPTASTNTGSTLAGNPQRTRQRTTIGRHDRRFTGGIDFGKNQGVDATEDTHEIVETIRVFG